MFVYGSEIYLKLKTCKEKNKSRHYSVQPGTSLLKFSIEDKIFFKAREIFQLSSSPGYIRECDIVNNSLF